jgi:hypothetical protein
MPRMSEMLPVIRNFKKYIDDILDDPINKFSDVQILYDFINERYDELFNESSISPPPGLSSEFNPSEFNYTDYLQESDDEIDMTNSCKYDQTGYNYSKYFTNSPLSVTDNDVEFIDSDDDIDTQPIYKKPETINITKLYNNDKLPRDEIHLYKKKPHINKIDKFIKSCYKY